MAKKIDFYKVYSRIIIYLEQLEDEKKVRYLTVEEQEIQEEIYDFFNEMNDLLMD